MADEIKGASRFKPSSVYHIPSKTWHERSPADCKEIVATSPDEWSFSVPEDEEKGEGGEKTKAPRGRKSAG